MSVRRLEADDAAAFMAVRLEGLRNHPEAFGASAEEEVARPLAQVAQRLSVSAVFGGFDQEGTLQGVIGLAMGASPKTRHVATVWGMYVRPRARGTGLSRQLLARAVTEASGTCRSVHLTVESGNQAARSLYRRAGFREWATDVAALYVNGVYHDEVLMRLDFD